MPGKPSDAGSRQPPDPRAAAFSERAAIALLAVGAAVTSYFLFDFAGNSAPTLSTSLLRVAQLSVLLVTLLLLRRSLSYAGRVVVFLCGAAVVAGASAFLGWLRSDTATTPMIAGTFSVLASVLLPWGWREQAWLAGVSLAASFGCVVAVHGDHASLLSYPALLLIVALAASVYVASILEEHRREAAYRQRELERNEARYGELVANIDALVWEAELPSWKFTFLSRTYEDLLGIRSEDPVALTTISERVHPSDLPRWREAIAGLSSAPGYEVEYRICDKNREWIWLREIARVSDGEGGSAPRVRGFGVNVTRLHHEQEMLGLRQRQLESINQAMSAYVERRDPVETGAMLLRGAIAATGSAFGFGTAVVPGGRLRLFAVEAGDFADAPTRIFVAALAEEIARRRTVDLPADDPFFARALALKQSQIAANGEDALAAEPFAGHPAIASFFAYPVTVQGEVIGVLGLANRAGGYGPEQENEIEVLANAAAAVYEGFRRDIRQAALERRRDQLVEILDATPDTVSTCDRFGNIRYLNRAGRRLLGIADDADVTQLRFGDFAAAEVAERMIGEVVPEALRAGLWSGETTLRTRDGSEVPIQMVLIAHKDARGRVRFFSVTVRDISERLRAAEEIRALNAGLEKRVADRTARLEELVREMEAFSYSISHDLRAPLRRVDGFCHVLVEDYGERLDDGGMTALRRIRESAQQMGALIDAMLKLSRVSRGEVRRETVDLSLVAESIIQDLRLAHPGREVDFHAQPRLIVDADPEMMELVLANLLENAWKYTRNRDKAKIEFGATPSAEGLVYYVRDNGAGFDMKLAGKLFRSFQRLHAMHEFEGTGIGLATVDRVVRRHGGRVWADAAVDHGATISFTLPPAAPGEGDDDSAEGALRRGLRASAT